MHTRNKHNKHRRTHLARRVHAPDRAHQRRLHRVGRKAVAARDAAEEREQVADAGDGEGQALGGCFLFREGARACYGVSGSARKGGAAAAALKRAFP